MAFRWSIQRQPEKNFGVIDQLILSDQNVALHTNVLGVRNLGMALTTVVRISQTKTTQIIKVTMTP